MVTIHTSYRIGLPPGLKRIRSLAAAILLALYLVFPAETAFSQSATVEDLQKRVQDVYKNASNSVVNITTTTIVANWFNSAVPREGSGSGFIWDKLGHVVTNYHVIEGAQSIIVSCGEDEVFEAELIGADPATDLAVLQISHAPSALVPLELADSDALIVGQFVTAIGNPFGYNRTLTFGIISALGRVVQSANNQFISEAIQTDTPINPGNSGGPLLDLNGRVVGINSSIISPNGVSAGIGFAIPANTVSEIIPVLIRDGKYPHPWLGFSSLDLTAGIKVVLERAGMNIPVDTGIIILETADDGPAAEAGLRGSTSTVQYSRRMSIPIGGDIIVAANGQEIRSLKDFNLFMQNHVTIGQRIRITYYRNGRRFTRTAIASELPGV